ncbi:MAG: DUF4430 domain-containing protein [Candidatus Paceibacterota bacterium]
MKNNKKISIAFIIFSILFIGFFYYFNFQIGVKLLSEVQKGPKALSVKNVEVSLNVLDKKYEVEIREDSSVFEVMQKIQEESMGNNLFSFKYREHPGLGIFINEINGKKGGEGGYWIYYVNGEEANIGVSNYKINNGDIISWKYEK